MKTTSISNRKEQLEYLKQNSFDIIVIGGGITGAGVLLEAQLRGLKCCLVEMQDFAEGTSSRSTKLIHGGLRYLKQFKFGLVAETGKERTVIERISRHLTRPTKVLVPSYKGGTFSRVQLRLAMWVYEFLARVPTHMRHKYFNKDEVIQMEPKLDQNHLLGGVEYIEFQTNDSRLTIEVIKTAVNHGAIALSRLKVDSFLYDANNNICGVVAEDKLDGNALNIKGSCVINAAGPWSEQLAKLTGDKVPVSLFPTKGVHLVFRKSRFNVSQTFYLDTPDKRMFFVIPNGDIVYVGTTDTAYHNDLSQPLVTIEDINYLLSSCNQKFPQLKLTQEDIISSWAGIRPLIKGKGNSPSEISRKHELYQHNNGLLTITGGKLTGYRTMAKQVVEAAIKSHFSTFNVTNANTESIQLTGSNFSNEIDFVQQKEDFIAMALDSNWSIEEANWVFQLFGSNAATVLRISLLPTSLPKYLACALHYCLDNEMVIKADDFFTRRTGMTYFEPEFIKKNAVLIEAYIEQYFVKYKLYYTT